MRINTMDAICDRLVDNSSVRGTGSKSKISTFRPYLHHLLFRSEDTRFMEVLLPGSTIISMNERQIERRELGKINQNANNKIIVGFIVFFVL